MYIDAARTTGIYTQVYNQITFDEEEREDLKRKELKRMRGTRVDFAQDIYLLTTRERNAKRRSGTMAERNKRNRGGVKERRLVSVRAKRKKREKEG